MLKRYLVLVLVFMIALEVQAQETTTRPVIALAKGDIWAINADDGSIKQITHYPQDLYYYQPVGQNDLAISPDGRYLAYLRTPAFFAIAMRNNLVGDPGEAPANVILLDLTTGEEKVIAEQQANAQYSDTPRLWFRSQLTWSPDGSQLAYYQHRGDVGQYQAQYMVYDLATGKTTQFARNGGFQHEITWLSEGINVAAAIYSTSGDLLTEHSLNDWVVLGHTVNYQGEDYKVVDTFGFDVQAGQTYLMNIHTGEFSVVAGYEASVSPSASQEALVFIRDDNNVGPSAVLDRQTGNQFVMPEQPPLPSSFTLSPDGKQFAYIRSMSSVIISDLKGKELVINLPVDAVVWGSKQRTIANESGDQSAPVVATTFWDTNPQCGTLPPVGLVAGGQGQVTAGGSSNRVRSGPFLAADVIAVMPAGATFTVVDGEQGLCNDGIRWAQVEYEGVWGWTAEGADGEVFLEPLP